MVAPAVTVIADSSFEALRLGSDYSSYAYNPTGTPWTFVGQAGVSGNNTGFTSGNPAAPQGIDVAFLQNKGSLSQAVVTQAAGTYTLSFSAAQRGNGGTSTQSIQVLVDGAWVGTFTPSGTSYQAFTTTPFAVTAGSHTITFQGLNLSGDNTAFLDGVSVNQAAQGVAASLGDSNFEAVSVGGSYDAGRLRPERRVGLAGLQQRDRRHLRGPAEGRPAGQLRHRAVLPGRDRRRGDEHLRQPLDGLHHPDDRLVHPRVRVAHDNHPGPERFGRRDRLHRRREPGRPVIDSRPAPRV